MKMAKKAISVLLALCLCVSMFPPAFAAKAPEASPDISPEALRVSDAFAAKYPNGLVELATVNFDTVEGAEDFTVYVVRRGGTSGKVTVDLKAIETTAKYGEDFTMLLPDGTEIKKGDDSPTMLESAVESGEYSKIAPESEESKPAEKDAQTVDNVQTEDTQIEKDVQHEADTQAKERIQTDVSDENRHNQAYASSLHKLRDEALGVTSEVPKTVNSDAVYDVENSERAEASAALNAVMPGAVTTLTFADGENCKTLKIHICNDDTVESSEQFNLGLCNLTGGAVYGDAVSAGCNIADNDEGAGAVLSFGQTAYTVYPSDGQAELTLLRTGDTQTYASFEVSTLSGTAEAGADYESVVTDAIFMPGETSKTISVPLLASGAEKEKSFEVVVTQEDKSESIARATITIKPEEDKNSARDGLTQTRALTGSVSAFPAASENVSVSLLSTGYSGGDVTIFGDEFASEYAYLRHWTFNGNENIDLSQWWKSYGYRGKEIVLNAINRVANPDAAYARMYKWLDLRGISYITVDWFNTLNSAEDYSYVFINDAQVYQLNKSFSGSTGLDVTKFPRINGVKLGIGIKHGDHGADTYFGVQKLTLHKQDFSISLKNPEPLSYTKWQGKANDGTGSYIPGVLVTDAASTKLGDSLSFSVQRSDEGKARDAEYIGYSIYTKSGWVNFYDKSTAFTIPITADFINNYIYGNGSTSYAESLIIRPIFQTRPATVSFFDSAQGTLHWGDYHTAFGSTTATFPIIDWVKTGDELYFGLVPATGYSGKGAFVEHYLTEADAIKRGRNDTENVNLPSNAVVVRSGYNDITPVFAENNKSVFINWQQNSVGNNEEMAENVAHGTIFHDHEEYMPAAEKAKLYAGTSEPGKPLPNGQTEAQREAIIAQNYKSYRTQYANRSLQKLSIGEMVTLYAVPDEGYTVVWSVSDTTDAVATKDLLRYAAHMGPSFTFEVTNELKGVYYYFVPVNSAGKTLLSGKVITQNSSLTTHFTVVDLKNHETYVGVPGATVSVAVTDSRYSSTQVGGKTYYTTATTDEDGNYTIYVPFGAENYFYSVRVIVGDLVHAESVLLGKNIYIELPFMDNFKASKFTASKVGSGGARLPLTSTFVIPTESSSSPTPVEISLFSTTDDGRVPTMAKLRSYTASGNLWAAKLMTSSDWKNWKLTIPDMREFFKDGGRMTLEFYDDTGKGYGEIESGYSYYQNLGEHSVALPSIGGDSSVDLAVIGLVTPGVDLGTSSEVEAESNDDKEITVSFNVGDTFKSYIAQNVEKFGDMTALQKAIALTDYAPEIYSTSKSKEVDWAKNSSAKTGIQKSKFDFDFDIGFYLKLTKQKGDGVNIVFDYAVLYAAAKLSAQQDFTATIYGVPVYARLRGDIKLKTLLVAQGDKNKPYQYSLSMNGWLPDLDKLKDEASADGEALKSIQFGGVFAFGVTAAIGGGVGTRGVLSAGLEGEVDLDIAYEPWTEGKGTVTLALNADIDVLVLPLHFTLTKADYKIFETDGYTPESWISDVGDNDQSLMQAPMARQLNQALSEATLSGSEGSYSRATDMSPWNDGSNMVSASSDGIDGSVMKLVLQGDIYKHPQPQLLSLGNGKKLLFFLNDDLDRGDYDRAALYYSVYSNGAWSKPTLVQNDGTLDSSPYAKLVGSKVLVTWTSANKTFGNAAPDMAALLASGEIYARFFDLDGVPEDDAERLTFDNAAGGHDYGDADPKIAYDSVSSSIMVLYTKTDYNTENVTYENPDDIGDFLNNSYSTVAYRMYVDGAWQTNYYPDETNYLAYEAAHGAGSLHGERFIDFDIAGVEPSKIADISLGSYDGEAQIIYSYDTDGDPATDADTELYMKVYSFGQHIFTPPVRLTEDDVKDSNPQQAQYGDKDYLFWNHGGSVSYLDVYSLLNYDITRHDNANGSYYYTLNNVAESYKTVWNERNDTAGESFTVTVGDNGGMYVVWEEQAGDGNSGDNRGRQLFAASYDPEYYTLGTDTDGNTIYGGGWGAPQQLTNDIGDYNNEQSVCVGADGVMTIACRNYERVPDDSTGDDTEDTRESNLSNMVVRTVAPTSSLAVENGGISVYPEYPKAGEPFTLTVGAENTGLLPVQSATFRIETTADNGGTWIKLCDDIVLNYHIPSGENISATANLQMPPDYSQARPLKLRISAWTGGDDTEASQTEYTISPQPSLAYDSLAAEFTDQDTVHITGTLQNTGSSDTEDLKLTLNSQNDGRLAENASEPLKLGELTVGAIKAGEGYDIDTTVTVDASKLNPGADMNFILSVKQPDGGDCRTLIAAAKPIAEAEPTDILINDGAALSLPSGATASLGATILPYAAANSHRLRYTSLTPEIAEVDASSGRVTAKKVGTAQILVEAESIDRDAIYLMGKDGLLYDAEGKPVQFEETGEIIGAAADAGNGEVALTKTVTLTVTANGVTLQVPPAGTVTGDEVSAALSKLESGEPLNIVRTGSSVTLSADALKTLKNAGNDTIISLGGVALRLSAGVMSSIAAKAGSGAEFAISQTVGSDGRPVVEITVKSGGTELTDFGGERLFVTIPYRPKASENLNTILVYYIDSAGNSTPVTGSRYSDGVVSFMTDHLSKYAVTYKAISFSDANGWAADYVAYLAARGIVSGTGNGKFTPDRAVTRAEFVAMLARLSGDALPKNSSMPFSDVAKDAWYAPYVAWAAEKNYVNGTTETTFSPGAQITREQMAAIIARFAETEGYALGRSGTAASFTDGDKISRYAKDAVDILSKAGILSGRGGGVFAPHDSTTRAECSKVLSVLLYKLLENMGG